MSNLLTRIAVALVGIPVALGLVWYGGLPLALLVMLAAVLGTGELFALAESTGVRPLRGLGMTLAALAPFTTWLLAGERPMFDFGFFPLFLFVQWPLAGALIPVLVLAAVLGTRELFGLAEATGVRPLRRLGMTLAALAPFTTWLLAGERPMFDFGFFPLFLFVQWPLAGALIPVLVLAAVLVRRAPAERPLSVAAVTLLGPLYCGVLPSALLVIRYAAGPERSWAATWLVFFPLAVTWLCDSFAMWGGKMIGGPKLFPSVSPGKTRSGAAAGVLGGVVTALVFVPVALAPVGRSFSLGLAACMGLVIAVVAQVGDLVESLFKREAGVKDSSALIPGHGGVLDRLDSLYFVLPVTAFLYRAFGVL